MSKCRKCGRDIGWIKVIDKNIPVEGTEEYNIVQDRNGDIVGITADGLTVKGYITGDADESGYLICRKKHICESEV